MRRWKILCTVTISGAALFSAAPLAHASSLPGPFPPVGAVNTSNENSAEDEVLAVKQSRLTDYATWLGALPGINLSGYIAAKDNVADLSSSLIWHGSSNLQAVATAEAKRRGITVSFMAWPYSRNQISEGIDAAWKEARTDAAWKDFIVADIVGLDPEHPGITVEGDWKAASRTKLAAADYSAGTDTNSLASKATAAAGVKVMVVSGIEAGTSTATRSSDVSPFDSGGYMISPSTGHTCSTGFAIHYGGATHTTTARHCVENDYVARDNSSTSYGSSIAYNSATGSRVLSKPGAALNFDGAWNNSAGFTKKVVQLQTTLNIGDNVYTSGGNSGVHGTIKITKLNVSFNDGYSTFYTIEAVQQTSGKIAEIQGDSGGPVFTPHPGATTTEVNAAGMIQGWTGSSTTGSACGSVHDAGTNRCSANLLFSPESHILSNLGATLVVN